MGKDYFAVLAIGKDGPGIVAALTGVVSKQHGCNVEASQMLSVGGYFATTLVASADSPIDCDELEAQLLEAGDGVAISGVGVAPIEPSARPAPANQDPTHMIKASAGDRPAVLHEIAEALARNDVNITGLFSTKSASDNSRCVIELDVEAPSSIRRTELEKTLVDELPSDISIAIKDWRSTPT